MTGSSRSLRLWELRSSGGGVPPPPAGGMTLPRRQPAQLARIAFSARRSAAARALLASASLGVVAALALLLAGLAASTAAAQENAPYGDVPTDAYYAVPVRTLDQDGVFAGTLCDDGFCPSVPIDRKTMAVWTVRVLDGDDPPAVSEARFDDVDAAGFYAPFIERMAELEVTRGCGDGSGFCPDRNVTRAEMAVFISRAYDLPDGPDPGFSDVAEDAWYAADVARLAASKITVGCGDGTRFCHGRETTRGQMATFLWRAENPDWQSVTDDQSSSDDDGSGPAGGSVSDPDEVSDVLEGPGDSGAPEPIEGHWVIPVFLCAPVGKYTEADLREWTDALNDDLDGFFERLSSGRMTLRFAQGAVLSDDTDWENTFLSELRLDGVFPCGEEATIRSGTSQNLILSFADVADHRGSIGGYAWLGIGPAVVGISQANQQASQSLRAVVHELAHSVLGLHHLKLDEFGGIFINEFTPDYVLDQNHVLDQSLYLACYQYEQLDWPVPDYAQPCSRLSPSEPEVLFGQTDGDGYAVTWERPRFSDDAPVTGYVLRLYTGTSFSHDDKPYAEFQKPADARSHTIDESIVPGTYLAHVWALSKYGEGDPGSVVVEWAPLPPPFGPIRVRDITHDTIHLVVDTEDHRDFQDETNEYGLIYEVKYTGEGQTDYEDVWGGGGDSVWFSLTDLEPDTEYTIRVRACANPYSYRRCTSWISTEASTSADAALRPPAPISIATGSDWYLLTWDLVPGAESYQIELPSGGQLRTSTPDFEQAYGLEPDTSYSLRVGSCRSRTFSCKDGEWTEVTFTTASEPTVAPPYRVALREIGDSWVTLMWKGGQAWRYRAEYEYTDGTTSSGLLHRQHQGEIPLRLAVEPNKTYEFKIRNCPLEEHDSACSAWTSFAFSTFPAASSVVAPSISVADRADVWLGFSWEHVTGAVSYESQYRETEDNRWVGWQNVQTLSVELVSYIEPDTEYTVQVRSCGEPTRPCSSWATTTTTTARSLPSAPSSYPVSIVDVTDSQVHLAWDEPPPGGSYEFRWYPTDERGRTYVNSNIAFTNAVISNLEPGTTYTIAVRTCGWLAGIVCDNWVTLNATTRQHP